ncbi:ATP-dependent zinc metalloprotease FtsH [Candidatus Weimeria sp. HCP3S3_B5]|uniref:ATP-dependent zinc metalloprotease FtsH n=1 Tax=Candidatus Weimeria sp. HCP3S3_B5 TaxID=3438871 RepID=UPI003F89C1B6
MDDNNFYSNNNGGNGDPNGGNGGPDGNQNPKFNPIIAFVLFSLIALFIVTLLYKGIGSSASQKVSYDKFFKLAQKNELKSVTFDGSKINFKVRADSDFYANTEDKTQQELYQQSTGQKLEVNYYTGYLDDDDLLPLLKQNNVTINREDSSSTSALLYNIISFIVPLIIIWIIFAVVMRRMGSAGGMLGGVGKSNAKVYVQKATGVTFADVAGQDEAKESLQEVVDFLKNPDRYTRIGAKLPKGALLVGPPGTGKTLLAKAVAGEAGVPFFSLAGSDFVEMFVGVGASRVRDLFNEAKRQAPCIIFIDEIDAIGKSRDSRYGGGNDEREQTLNQLLAEMDGFDTSKGLLILAATNRPEVLDKALLRPGRFDRRIIVDRPDMKGRLETLRVHAKDVRMDSTCDLEAIALASAGLVGSDLANIINEAAILAVENGREFVSQPDLFEAFERVAVGGKEKKDRPMSDKERHIVSYHEVGHALVSALQKNTDPVQKITIVPRTMGALGYTLQTPEEEKFLQSKEELEEDIATFMGGRAAEDIVFHSITSGAANDIEKATSIARNMVTRFGMSDRFGMMGLATVESQYLDGGAQMTCGEATAAEVDNEVHAIIDRAYKRAVELLSRYRSALDQISEYLYKKETITGKEFMDMFRRITGIEAEPSSDSDDEKVKKDQEVAERLQKEMDSYESSKTSQKDNPDETSGTKGPEVTGDDIFDE